MSFEKYDYTLATKTAFLGCPRPCGQKQVFHRQKTSFVDKKFNKLCINPKNALLGRFFA